MYYYRYENAEVSCCYKYLMFSYNIVFWLLGAALIAAGLWAWSEKGVLQDLSVLTRIHGFDPVWALLVAGVVMFVLGFAGCVGALRENLCLLKATWCCGAQGPEDWEHNPYFSCNSTNASRERCGVPFSCCVLDPAESVVNSQCGYDVRKRAKPDWSEQIHTRGCISALEQWVPGNLYTVALVFVIVSVLQMLGIYLARSLITDIYKVQINHIRNPVY
ncbi:tetraspanin-14 isoform X2 [Periophthalmus magnuspinnatus]|uniref:tetraspanin-14 isoform X2 n=1 Tax=Periophthalmus magnuspinnatus TaxID=409849 RepID=UPI002437249E|nr:tetraspanin-14 isoform X2 [Periophthalmus magnuspinnatus]